MGRVTWGEERLGVEVRRECERGLGEGGSVLQPKIERGEDGASTGKKLGGFCRVRRHLDLGRAHRN